MTHRHSHLCTSRAASSQLKKKGLIQNSSYTAGNGVSGDCSYDYDGMTPTVGLTGYNMLPTNDQDAVMQHLAEVGPLAVSVYARYEEENVME